MIHLLLESIGKHVGAREPARRFAELTLSRQSLRVTLCPRLPNLWVTSVDIVKLNYPEQEKSGLHVSARDADNWSSVYYRRPGGRVMVNFIVGRGPSWFEKTAARWDAERPRGVA